jgi:prophage tail gpP-like protein
VTSDEVTLHIAGQRWRFFDDLEINLGLDSHPTVGFSAPFDHRRREFRDTFRQFSFRPLEVAIGGQRVFTGVLVEVQPRCEPDASTVSCAGYSKAAQLETLNLPADKLPFQASGLSLRQIAQQLAGAYDIGVEIEGPEGAAFRRVKTRSKKIDTQLDHEQKIGDFLIELAKQRGLLVSSTVTGDLLFRESVRPGNPVVRLAEGQPPLVSVAPTYNPQDYYTEITGFTSAKRGVTGSKYTQRLERLQGGTLRALSFKLDDIEKGDAAAAVKAKVGRMLANAFTVTLNVPTWRDPSGALWSPNTTITLTAPGAMIYRETELLVRDVFLKQSAGEQTASLGCVLPGTFGGEIPPRLPWED